MRTGDSVADRSGLTGRVVANMDQDEFSPDYPKDQWAYLARGVLVKTDEVGLMHYQSADELKLVLGPSRS
jgi:hypothetical protein